jgi:hypothetical protein
LKTATRLNKIKGILFLSLLWFSAGFLFRGIRSETIASHDKIGFYFLLPSLGIIICLFCFQHFKNRLAEDNKILDNIIFGMGIFMWLSMFYCGFKCDFI